MRIGIFGGSFDPVHLGHLKLAEACCRQARLDQIQFTPAAQQPHKPQGLIASGAHRVAMLRLAIGDEPRFAVSTAELDRGGVSYTVDTLRELKARDLSAELFLLMGADSLSDFPKWREAGAICELATLVVVHRAGLAEPDFGVLTPLASPARVAEVRGAQVEMPEMPISSSQIRQLIAADGPWQSLVPAAVAEYIKRHGLYGA